MKYINIETMRTYRLKPDRSITGLYPAIISLIVFAASIALFGLTAGFNALGGIILIYAFAFGLYVFIKTGNAYHLVVFAYLLLGGIGLLLFDPDHFDKHDPEKKQVVLSFMAMIYLFALWLAYLFFNKKLKWRGREVMELAAGDIPSSEESFTNRPRPVGKVECTSEELDGFVSFLRKNLIFMSWYKDGKYVLHPVKQGNEYNVFYNYKFDPEQHTCVIIDEEGDVTVFISQQDYLDYKEDLSFDALSNSLGKLTIEFMNLYLNGNEVRIMDRINEVKIGVFS